MFSVLARKGVAGHRPIEHCLLTTRRGPAANTAEPDELKTAASAIELEFRIIPERRVFDQSVLYHLASRIRDFRPDIIETHDCKSHFLLYLLRRRHRDIRRAKWVAFHHGYTRSGWRIAAYQQLDRLSLRHVDQVVTVCKPFAETLAARGVSAARISVISNSLTPRDPPLQKEVNELRRSLGIVPGEILVLSVGRLSREKAHSDLIRALSHACDLRPDVRLRLILVGDGPERERLKVLATHVQQRVLFAGHVRDPWVFYHAADIFVLCSLTEGSPLALLEAMAANLPIIASAVGGIPETLVHQASGLLVPAADRAALSQALIDLAENSSMRERLGRAAGLAVRDHLPDSYANRLLAIYARAMTADS
jgi:glycosyltransferase involved in cell wall biosynthesis